jgi:hypothetical protein
VVVVLVRPVHMQMDQLEQQILVVEVVVLVPAILSLIPIPLGVMVDRVWLLSDIWVAKSGLAAQ